MDGVIIDSEHLWRKADMDAFAQAGIEMSLEEAQKGAGLRIDDLVYQRQRTCGFDDKLAKKIINNIFSNVSELILSQGIAKSGLHQAIENLCKHDIKLAVASSTPLSIIQLVLKKFGLDKNTFAAVCSGEFEKYAKPHPSVYLTVMQKLGASPFTCAAIEDSLAGVISVKAARIYCIAVPEPWENYAKGYNVADKVIPNLNAIDDNFVKKLVSN